MSDCPFCKTKPSGGDDRPKGFFRRARRTADWLFPAAILALMPKCPLCVAAYIALGTGIGISVSTAKYLRISMVVVCLGSLVYLAAKWAINHHFRQEIGPCNTQ